jgi:hypothetical protein
MDQSPLEMTNQLESLEEAQSELEIRIPRKNNVLLVEYMKHNILSVIQICDEGHKLVFDSQNFKIRKAGSSRVVAIAVRTSRNIYVLSEIGNEKCCLGKEDEV